MGVKFNITAGKNASSSATKQKDKPKTKAVKVKASAPPATTAATKKTKQTETKVNVKIFEPKKTKAKAPKGNVATVAGSSSHFKNNSNSTTKTKTTNHSKATSNKRIHERFTPLFKDVTPSTVFHHLTKELPWNPTRISALSLLVVIVAMHIACTVTTEWLNYNLQSQGIWRICYQQDFESTDLKCFRYDDMPDYLKQIQALMIVALLVICFGIVYFYFWLRKKERSLMFLVVAIEIAALLMVVTMAIYTDNHFCAVAKSKLGTFGWSYYLGWLTTLLTIGTGIFINFKV